MLGAILGAILVDAFNNPLYGPAGLNFRTGDFVAVDPGTAGGVWHDPEWLHAGPSGIRLGVRERDATAPAAPISATLSRRTR